MAKGRKHCFIDTSLPPAEVKRIFLGTLLKRRIRAHFGYASLWKPSAVPEHVAPAQELAAVKWVATLVQQVMTSLMSKQSTELSGPGNTVIVLSANSDPTTQRTTAQMFAALSIGALGMVSGSATIGKQYKRVFVAVASADPSATVTYQ